MLSKRVATFIAELCIAALPSSDDKSVYLSTIGVPIDWHSAVMDTLINQRHTEEETRIRQRFMLAADLNWRTMHILIGLIRTRKTTECYETGGSVSSFDEGLVRSQTEMANIKWRAKPTYAAILDKIATFFKEDPLKVHKMDQSLRYKRSKRDPSLTVTTEPDAQSFVFVGFRDIHGVMVSQWVDIGLSDDLPQQNILAPKPIYKGERCHAEGCTAFYNLRQCTRCMSARYCNREHQKTDWPRHKIQCLTYL